jgi:hypothetical protein
MGGGRTARAREGAWRGADSVLTAWRCRNAAALRSMARNWLPLLFNAFLATPAAEAGALAATISAYAAVCDAAAVAGLFREVIKKLIKVRAEAGARALHPPCVRRDWGSGCADVTPCRRRRAAQHPRLQERLPWASLFPCSSAACVCVRV